MILSHVQSTYSDYCVSLRATRIEQQCEPTITSGVVKYVRGFSSQSHPFLSSQILRRRSISLGIYHDIQPRCTSLQVSLCIFKTTFEEKNSDLRLHWHESERDIASR